MLKIDFKKHIDSKGNLSRHIEVNGKEDLESVITNKKFVNLYSTEVIKEFLKVSFLDIKSNLSAVAWNHGESEIDYIELKIILDEGYDDGVKKFPAFTFKFCIDTEMWAKPWSIFNFYSRFKEYVYNLNDENIEFFEEEEGMINEFGIRFYISSFESIVEDEIKKCYSIFQDMEDKVNYNLISDLNKSSYIEIFNFPVEVRTICEQYLIYFTQFLKDIGIEATSNIITESGKVLFSVTHSNKDGGLKRIKEALDIYLRFPSTPDIYTYEGNEIAVQQLQANIFHLKSQLMLAKGTMQLKDATIESLQLSNYQYKMLLDSKSNDSKEKEMKSIYDAIVIKLDWPEQESTFMMDLIKNYRVNPENKKLEKKENSAVDIVYV